MIPKKTCLFMIFSILRCTNTNAITIEVIPDEDWHGDVTDLVLYQPRQAYIKKDGLAHRFSQYARDAWQHIKAHPEESTLFVCAVLICGYLFYDQFQNQKDVKNIDEKKEAKEVDDEEVNEEPDGSQDEEDSVTA